MSQISIPAATASSIHLSRIGERGEPDLGDARPRQPIFEQAADRIAVHRPVVGLAHVEMGVEGDQAHLLERQAEPVRGGAGDRIVAAEQERQPVRRACLIGRRADRLEPL